MTNDIQDTMPDDKEPERILTKVDTLKTPETPEGNPFIPGNLSVDEATTALLAWRERYAEEARNNAIVEYAKAYKETLRNMDNGVNHDQQK